MREVNEKQTVVIVATFKDENGVRVTPNSTTYRLDDDASGEELISDTTVTPTTYYYNILIPPEQNTILNQDRSKEVRILTVVFLYEGSSKQGSAEYRYAIKNLRSLT